jgi:hypothetical protein
MSDDSNTKTLERDVTIDGVMMSRAEFCKRANISMSAFHSMKRSGNGPEETYYAGSNVARISIEAYHAWQAKNEAWSKSKEVKLEIARRRENAIAAGKKAAESPKHVSKRGKRAAARSAKG